VLSVVAMMASSLASFVRPDESLVVVGNLRDLGAEDVAELGNASEKNVNVVIVSSIDMCKYFLVYEGYLRREIDPACAV